MKEIPAKIEKKYIPKGDKAVSNLHVHVLEDITIKAGECISLSPNEPGKFKIFTPDEHPIPYWSK